MRSRSNKAIGILLFALFSIVGFATGSSAEQPAMTVKQIYRAYKDSVLLLVAEETGTDGHKSYTYGTAFAIDESGLLLTSAHLIGDSIAELRAVDSREQSHKVASAVWVDRDKDLALIKIEGTFKPVILASLAEQEIGEQLTIISNPSGLQNTVSQGILSSKRKRNALTYVQFTAPISPGSSGGPVFNERGQVIGVIHGIFAEAHAQNLNFAIPIDYLPRKFVRGQIILEADATEQSKPALADSDIR